MASVLLEIGYRDGLPAEGPRLLEAVDRLPALVVGCHPDRYVARVNLTDGPVVVQAYLKRERRVAWKERLANWWAGVGFVSKSVREARLLRQLRRAGINCPAVIAAGEDRHKGAFLLLRAMTDYLDLRSFLCHHLADDLTSRRHFARSLGMTLARLHAAGFDHPDLYSKHVVVHQATQAIAFLDWQRSRRHRRLGLRQRCRDLAALNATLGNALATAGDRLACLQAYLAAAGQGEPDWKAAARHVLTCSDGLRRKRRIRELCQEPLPEGSQVLVPLGDGVYAAPDVDARMTARLRDGVCFAGLLAESSNTVVRTTVSLSGGRRAILVRRVRRPRGWFWAWLRGRPLLSPERRQADAIYRLERYGVPVPRLLAYGQRQSPPWRQESVLLTEVPAGALSLRAWLEACQDGSERDHLTRDVARLLRRMHAAGCYLGSSLTAESVLLVQARPGQSPRVMLGAVEGLVIRRSPSPRLAAADFANLHEWFGRVRWNAVGEPRLLPCGAKA